MTEETNLVKPNVPLSDKDAVIANKILDQGGFPDVKIIERRQNLLALPEECKAHAKKYDFRWLSKDSRMIERGLVKSKKILTEEEEK